MHVAYKKNRKQELSALYQPCHRDLMLYCLGKFKDMELAKDAASETMKKLLEHPNPADIPNLKAWLLTVAKNVCLNILNTQKRRAELLNQVNFNDYVRSEAEVKMDNEKLRQLIRGALKDRDFEIWKLSAEGYLDEEIAERLDLHAKTVANRKSMIKKTLEEKIDRSKLV